MPNDSHACWHVLISVKTEHSAAMHSQGDNLEKKAKKEGIKGMIKLFWAWPFTDHFRLRYWWSWFWDQCWSIRQPSFWEDGIKRRSYSWHLPLRYSFFFTFITIFFYLLISGFTVPSAIQQRAIVPITKRRDVIAQGKFAPQFDFSLLTLYSSIRNW